MARSVTPIPATKNKFSSAVISPDAKKRVAGYARVSTDMDEQFTSFEAQMNYYTSFIKSHKDWEFVDVYSDEGISGTNTMHRTGFQQMIMDALSGKIDLIITKSVSRFARNTVDTLTTIRELKDKGVEVFFEKENIWTFDSKGELLITIMASLAQEESRSLSENIKWAVNKKFEQGKFSLPYKAFLGYDRGKDGLPVVNPEEAEIVREIYHRFLAGESPLAICHTLESKGIAAPRGGKKWSVSTITSILKNEKYAGNAVLQKSFTADFLTKKKQTNNGEVPKYYVKDSHEAIVTEEEYELVQQELKDRTTCCHQTYSANIYSDRIICGECGKPYGSKVWHSNDKYRRVIFRCNSKYSNGKEPCRTPHLTEDEIKEVFLQALNKLLTNKETVIQNLELLKTTLFSTSDREQIGRASCRERV